MGKSISIEDIGWKEMTKNKEFDRTKKTEVLQSFLEFVD